ncbi:hypothetical protein [Winogradskyella tangerina]|uniref:hypothetical protein n=1 Tax=Winogradskyella tangerina TaxID=2023240 RepID=UPI000DBE4868|nr:hypothetical protein [Winogradskyella tangerina]
MNAKYSKYILYALFIVFQLSCENESVETEPETMIDPLEGTWDLIMLEGGDFVTETFTWNPGERTLTFDTVNRTLTFIDNLNPDFTCPTCNATHNYAIVEELVTIINAEAPYIYLVENTDDDPSTNGFPFGWIDTLTDLELIIKTPGIIPTVWTFTKAE